MKKILFVLFLFVLVAYASKNDQKVDHSFDRIKVIESNYNGLGYEIIEVDGHQHLSGLRGGMVHLESCKCKNGK